MPKASPTAIPPSAFHQGQNQEISKENAMATAAKPGSFLTCDINQFVSQNITTLVTGSASIYPSKIISYWTSTSVQTAYEENENEKD